MFVNNVIIIKVMKVNKKGIINNLTANNEFRWT